MDFKNDTIGELLKRLSKYLEPISQDLANREASFIVENVLDIPISQLQIKSDNSISKIDFEKILKIADKRVSGTPLAYALEETFFYSKDFNLSKDTLIPRHDTEHLIQKILDSESDSKKIFLELGTGSGIIPEILTYESKNWSGITVDISIDALEIAKTNFSSDRVTAICSDKFSAISEDFKFDFIVSNPPYIPTKDVYELEKCVIDYEPLSALDGGETGLDFYEYLATTGKNYLKVGGYIYCEIGYDQGESVPAHFRENGWVDVELGFDFGNRPRVVSARRD